ncbi:hypothetical protein F4821DRAFT_245579 [Hypoxylon rubiginosum]|uniref:Uncharacterized protein n=1 Tax=Hypoxylon rubiginosum TaxID=110542 RepID=A0ACC0CS02_9PEZI|nr:hypothetical protein F4821DRAFT_245579 [Hypoxylon rubiginosum]
MPGDQIKHPSPAEAFELATKHAALLRALFLDPRYRYLQPPTAEFIKPDTDQTPLPLFFVADFVQETYINYVIPFLPAGATRKCKAVANPWAWNDPNYTWEWEWDAQTSTFKDAEGKAHEFPKHSDKFGVEKMGDVFSRGFMTSKIVLENATDMKARLMLGGKTFDFGEEVARLVKDTYPM